MSFSRDVKVELCQNDLSFNCKKAFLSAIIKLNSNLGISQKGVSINISFENVTIVRYIYEIIKEIYNIETQMIVTKKLKLNKGNIYTLKLVDKALEILDDLSLMDGFAFRHDIALHVIENEDERKAYLAGSFVAAGSINSPHNSNYHLEIQSPDLAHLENVKAVIELLNKGMYPLDINFKISKRRNNYVLYLKSAREIVDFLNYIGAINSTFKFEDIRLQRDFINSINRMNNMDVANEQKVFKAANSQIELIKLIDDTIGLDALDDKLKVIAKIRLENSEASLNELCEIYNEISVDTISKSGMNHRLRKIKEIAQEIKGRGEASGNKE